MTQTADTNAMLAWSYAGPDVYEAIANALVKQKVEHILAALDQAELDDDPNGRY